MLSSSFRYGRVRGLLRVSICAGLLIMCLGLFANPQRAGKPERKSSGSAPTGQQAHASVEAAADVRNLQSAGTLALQVNSTAGTLDGQCTAIGTGNGCTLSDALNIAEFQSQHATITFAPELTAGGPATITLTSHLDDLRVDTDIIGPGSNLLTVERSHAAGTPEFTIFFNGPHRSTISGLTISNGRGLAVGGIYNGGGNLTLTDVTIYGCSATSGPAAVATYGSDSLVMNNCHIGGLGADQANIPTNNYGTVEANGPSSSTLTINGGAIIGNQGTGVFIENGVTTLNGVTITNNLNPNWGGGVRTVTGAINIINCLIADNSAGIGAGIFHQRGTLTIANSTISGNVAAGEGGGIANVNATLTATNVTVTNNRTLSSGGTGGIASVEMSGLPPFSLTNLENTIVTGNFRGAAPSTVPADVSGISYDSFNNLIGTGADNLTGLNGNLVGVLSPLLAPLADNGGPTKTYALLPGSPAINAGNNTKLPADTLDLDADGDTTEAIPIDQRGFARITNTTVDIGAFESRGFTIAATGGMSQSTPVTKPFAAPLVVHLASAFGEPVDGGAVIFMPPANGASSIFSGSLSLGAMLIIQNGNATSPALTANNIAGSYLVSATANGVIDGASFPLTNLKGDQSISISTHAPPSAGYQSQFTVAANSSSGLAVAYSSAGACTNSGAVFTMTASSGTCTVRYDQPGDSNYNAATQVVESVTAQKSDQTIIFGSLANKTFGDADFNVSATATSGLPVTFVASVNCTVTVNNVHLTGAGSCTITASQPGDINYNAAPSVPQNFAIAKGASTTAVTSSVNPSDLGETVTFTASVTSAGGAPGGTVQFKDNGVNMGSAVSLSGGVAQFAIDSLPAGTRTISADYSGSGDFLTSTGMLTTGQVIRSQPTLSVDDVSALEGDSGTKLFNFTVTLGTVSHLTVAANFATVPGTADLNDFVPTSGVLTFAPGETTKTIPVTINGDFNFESNEQFAVNLSGSTNSTIIKPLGTGTILNDDAQGGFVKFNQSNYAVSESGGSINIVVNRTNNVSGAATVDYAISETGAPSNCGTFNGLASSRCDFTTVAGTLSFAAGETQKTFPVLISRDSFVEGAETFTVNLSNPTGGAVLATPFGSTVTINDDNSGLPANAIDDAAIFVRMHYHDFLNREGDQAGIDFWTGQMTNCGNADLLVCRVNVSGAFFQSIEFQQTGYLVERMYKTGYGDATQPSNLGGLHQISVPVVRANEFLADTQRIGRGVVVLQPGWETVLENNKQGYALEFVQTSRFITAFPTSMTPAAFVDKLDQNAGMVLSPSERTTAINLFGNAADTTNVTARAQALRQIAEDQDLFRNEFNRAFVLAEYIGYLRRNPNDAPEPTLDYTGYDFWLTKLNQFNGDYIAAEMVKAFISSDECRRRFGP